MSLSEIAAAVIGLRESTYKDHQRFSGTIGELKQVVEGMQATVDQTLDRRLAQAAQAVRDVERRLEHEYERRYEAVLMTIIQAVERLETLVSTARDCHDVGELQERLHSCSGPRDSLVRLLDEAGVRSFSSAGEPYDPHRHEVIRREHLDDCGHEFVLQELKPGYLREGTDHTLIRAKVIVAAPPVPIMEGRADG